MRCIVLDIVGAAEMSQQAPPPASAYIPNATAAVSSLNDQLSKPECCSLRVQLQQAVLPGVFPVFCRDFCLYLVMLGTFLIQGKPLLLFQI